MGSALSAAMDEHIENSLDPCELDERNNYGAMTDGKTLEKLPISLGEVLLHLEHDELVRGGLPQECIAFITGVSVTNTHA